MRWSTAFGCAAAASASESTSLTHNSLSTNLEGLDIAHAAVGDAYPEFRPVMTTCGVISGGRSRTLPRWLAPHRWRYRWLMGSMAAAPARRFVAGGRVVLTDLRLTIDDLLAQVGGETLRVLNIDANETFRQLDPVRLTRHGRGLTMTSTAIDDLTRRLSAIDDESCLITNVGREDLDHLAIVSAGHAWLATARDGHMVHHRTARRGSSRGLGDARGPAGFRRRRAACDPAQASARQSLN